jgi:hypothetical protein
LIHEVNFVQIQHDALICSFGCEQALQLCQSFHVDATTQGKDHHIPGLRSLNL